MLNSLKARNLSCEHEAKFIQDRIASVERTVAEFCNAFGEYSRKAARIRDKGDQLSQATLTFAEYEDINASLTNALAGFSNCMSLISDYGDVRVKSIDKKVVESLGKYESICKHAKEEVKQIYYARDRELTRKRQLDRLRERNPRNRQQIVQAETELVKATAEVSKTIHSLEEQMTSFERQKLHDLKAIFLDFISTEMGFHAKAIEILTKAYQDVDAVDEEADMQAFQKVRRKLESEFKKSLRLPGTIPHKTATAFRASQSLGSIASLFSQTSRKRSEGIPTPAPRAGKNTKSKSEETLDSLKRSISDTEESSEESSDEDSTEDKSSSVVVQQFTN